MPPGLIINLNTYKDINNYVYWHATGYETPEQTFALVKDYEDKYWFCFMARRTDQTPIWNLVQEQTHKNEFQELMNGGAGIGQLHQLGDTFLSRLVFIFDQGSQYKWVIVEDSKRRNHAHSARYVPSANRISLKDLPPVPSFSSSSSSSVPSGPIISYNNGRDSVSVFDLFSTRKV